ncbi:MAG: GAF domain-containing protein [Planctomycetes bacterium]|nr:GAF domain-containing protein [Planctomycetota bacterium]
MTARLADLQSCFQGIAPSVIATVSKDGEPNITYLSHVYYVDAGHVALSRQFFNKTVRNVAQNPVVTIVLYDPIDFRAYHLCARFERSETTGPLFETMSARIDVIASHTGMTGVFKLISADVYEVVSLEEVAGYLTPPDLALDALSSATVGGGPLTELRGLQVVSDRITRAGDLDEMLSGSLTALDELFGFSHAMVLAVDPRDESRLVTLASRGYEGRTAGLAVKVGEGLIGTVAARRRMLRVAGVGAELRYGRAVRESLARRDGSQDLPPELPLPGLPDAQAQLGLPLLVGCRLVGVLAVESPDPFCFDEWDEAYLQIVANQIAQGIDRLGGAEETPLVVASSRPVRRFVFYRNDDCVFVDGEYLVRNVPGRILWKLLGQHAREGRTEFTNRELRLDPALGLPALKDNLESRLILLRNRLAERCPDVRMVSTGRGRFALELDCDTELVERDTA